MYPTCEIQYFQDFDDSQHPKTSGKGKTPPRIVARIRKQGLCKTYLLRSLPLFSLSSVPKFDKSARIEIFMIP